MIVCMYNVSSCSRPSSCRQCHYWSIMSQTPDMTPRRLALYWHPTWHHVTSHYTNTRRDTKPHHIILIPEKTPHRVTLFWHQASQSNFIMTALQCRLASGSEVITIYKVFDMTRPCFGVSIISRRTLSPPGHRGDRFPWMILPVSDYNCRCKIAPFPATRWIAWSASNHSVSYWVIYSFHSFRSC